MTPLGLLLFVGGILVLFMLAATALWEYSLIRHERRRKGARNE